MHSRLHRLHNIFCLSHLRLIRTLYYKNTQYYVVNLLNVHGELSFFAVKSDTFARFLGHSNYSMQLNMKQFLRKTTVFYSAGVLYT